MKRIAIIAVLAALVGIGIVKFIQQPEESLPVEPVATAPAVPDEASPAADVSASDEEQPEMVEESAAEEDEAAAEERPIILAQADVPAAPQDWKYTEGTHFARMVPTQPTVGGADKIEVAEIFWYGCAHCYDFETYVDVLTYSMIFRAEPSPIPSMAVRRFGSSVSWATSTVRSFKTRASVA